MVELLLNTITLPAYHQQEAWVWIPILIVTGVLVYIFAGPDNTKTTKLIGKSIGVLGMIGAGKTQFLKNLQGKGQEYKNEGYQGTGIDEYQEFTCIIGNKEYKIKGGTDIGGVEDNIK